MNSTDNNFFSLLPIDDDLELNKNKDPFSYSQFDLNFINEVPKETESKNITNITDITIIENSIDRFSKKNFNTSNYFSNYIFPDNAMQEIKSEKKENITIKPDRKRKNISKSYSSDSNEEEYLDDEEEIMLLNTSDKAELQKIRNRKAARKYRAGKKKKEEKLFNELEILKQQLKKKDKMVESLQEENSILREKLLKGNPFSIPDVNKSCFAKKRKYTPDQAIIVFSFFAVLLVFWSPFPDFNNDNINKIQTIGYHNRVLCSFDNELVSQYNYNHSISINDYGQIFQFFTRFFFFISHKLPNSNNYPHSVSY